ncbi:pantetheine-phosphate adenylyltransferase [Succinivibrio dextrinosolvens]|uniref:Phosphopantetheine adenylyltransferase n=1 Tax=Succinivibrio dextrinosolvens TaxID=83771 RepID=A0A662Z6A5_9GAMM|nr:pantetheine-phosphate adenylyltransferase [Succinivibrio dextrinosolvens]SFJ78557.1 Phosphopantetheine adenylyltransferase [Succinivibrio dextrinosolvens]
MSNLAVFPGTFDPLTKGHLDIIRRASALFDKVIVAVANSPSKHTFLTLEERICSAKDALAEFSNVEVEGFKGLLIDYLKEKQCNVLVRGLRNATDYDYEAQLTGMYRAFVPELEIVFLQTSPDYSFISSTLVREIFIHGGDISKLVPQQVFELIISQRK